MGKRSTIEIQARLRDINAGGHVDNVEAIRVIGEARMRWQGLPGTGEGVFRHLPSNVVNLVASQRVDFRSEMRFAEFQNFEVTQWIGHIGRSSFTLQSEIRLATRKSESAAVLAETSVVLFDNRSQHAWPINGQMHATLSEYLGEPLELRDRPDSR